MCTRPLAAYRGSSLTKNGKRAIVFNSSNAFHELKLELPCGQCTECRLEKSRQMAVRMMHEASLYDDNCFLTLTYSPENLPPYGTLVKSDFQRFMKRLRKAIYPKKVRFFHAGEYGEISLRPHYHAILFGYDFSDKVYWTRRGDFPVWRSPSLERLWPCGQSELGSVSFDSAAYVARYVLKKVTGKDSEAAYSFVDEDGVMCKLQPEYATMSRRPGIGKPWLDKYMQEVYPSDSVIVRGREAKPPRYYDLAFQALYPAEAEAVCSERKRKRKREESTWERRDVRDEVVNARVNLFRRDVK